MVISVSKNNRVGWQKVFKKALQIKDTLIVKFIVNVDGESDVTNLRYAFPIISYLKRKNVTTILYISGNEGTIVSARVFLSHMVDNGTLVYYNAITKQNTQIINKYLELSSDLSELEIEMVATILAQLKESKKKKKIENSEKLAVLDGVVVEKTCFSYVSPKCAKKLHNGKNLIDSKLLKSAIGSVKGIVPESVELIEIDAFKTDIQKLEYNKKAYSYLYPSDIFPLLEINHNYDATKDKINCLIDFYKNRTVELKEFTFKRATATENKDIEAIQNKVKEAIPDFTDNVFAELIFYYLLRNMYINKTAFDTEKQVCTVNEEFIKKTALDARSYAEGLWQLLENAYLHSQGKTAFFGMRIYKSDTETTMSYIAKEATTREMLWSRYCLGDKSNIFNETDYNGNKRYRDFIEFYVLDDAINDEGSVYGVLDTLCSGNNGIHKESVPDSIAKVFDLKEDDYSDSNKVNYYIQHYGMRWLHKHVDNLKGIIQLFSPCSSVIEKHKGNEYIQKKNAEKCCYSNCSNADKLFSSYMNGVSDPDSSSGNGDDMPETAEETEKHIPYYGLYTTEYSILIPVSYKTEVPAQSIANVEKLSFDCDYSFYADAEYKYLDITPVSLTASKEENISSIAQDISRKAQNLNVVDSNDIPYIFAISLQDSNLYSTDKVELLAKALFKYIYEARSKSADLKLYFSLDFGEKSDLMQEFIRIFSIFYDKQGKNAFMENVQIALYSDYTKRKMEKPVKAIAFIIVGKNLSSAYRTATSFVYHNEDISLKHIPVLDYLCSKKSDKKDEPVEIKSLCPFELILNKNKNDASFAFLNQIEQKIKTDQRLGEYGCKLSSIHVKLGSKIIIDDFYEAELLFHNPGNIRRFAYLIARDIFENEKRRAQDGSNQEAVVALLGYEDYSSILIQEIKSLLKTEDNEDKLFYVTGYRHSKKVPEISFENVSETVKRSLKEDKCLVVCYTIVPVGATLSTFHKLHDSFVRGLDKLKNSNSVDNINKKSSTVEFRDNYLLIAVGDCYSDNNKQSEISRRYIQKISRAGKNSREWNVAEVVKQYEEDATERKKPPLEVKYCIPVSANWQDPLSTCEEHQNINETDEDDGDKSKADKSKENPADVDSHATRPHLKVDKTSTLLNTIFQSPLPESVLEFYKEDKNIELLAPAENEIYLKYGHVFLNDNHYQFFFDFDKIVNSEKCNKKIVEWAEKIEIDTKAFNIVISPLQASNSSFLKIILDNVFGSSLHLLHIDINGSSKEMIRTKFSYICNELKMITNAYSKINFYFVDDSICTGATISRAQKYLLMLCEQAGIADINGMNRFNVEFKKVILLINRNSYETARVWVNNPNTDWCGFINLCVPSYNTHADLCPACYVQRKFKLLEKRSATMEMVHHFMRNADKHQKRKLEEFEVYLENSMNKDPGYCDWLHTYLMTHANEFSIDEFKKINQSFNKLEEMVKDSDEVDYSIENFIMLLSKKVKENDKALIKLCQNPMKIIVGREHYQRLYSMNKAYKEIIYNPQLHAVYSECIKNNDFVFSEFKKELTLQILKLLNDSLNTENYYDRILSFVSYIKVISRDYIAKTYYIREAIYEIMHCIFIIITEGFGNPNKIISAKDFKETLSIISKNKACIPAKEDLLNVMGKDEYYEYYYNIWQKIRVDLPNASFDCRVVYRLVKLVVHRLAQLNSPYIIKKEVIDDALKAYNRLCKRDKHHLLPSQDKIVEAYLASIKTASMSIEDEKMCFDLLDLYKGWCEENE